MEEVILEEKLKELMKIEGGVRGESIQADLEFIRNEVGEEGLEKLERELKKLGSPIDYKNIRALDFYPLGWQAIMMVCTEKLFGFDEEKFWKWGRFLEKSLLVRLFVRHFVSIERAAKEAPRMWRHNLTVGDLKVIGLDKEKKNLILRLENFTILPYYCHALRGYFSSVVQMVIGGEVLCEERKCVFRGDEYHEFVLRW